MLDKTVPYVSLFMCKKAGTPIPDFPLPEGFRYTFFKDGDETDWARIEASVLEFDSEFAALLFFKENFIPYTEDLHNRCLFIENRGGEKVATATAWWSHLEGQCRPWIHWVGTTPMYQGLGLGKSITARATGLLTELDGDEDIYLKTQTWSYKAIGIYNTCGFKPTDEKVLYSARKSNYKKALRVLKRLNQRGIFRLQLFDNEGF